MDPRELRRQLEALREEIRTLSETEDLTEEQETRFAAALEEWEPLEQRTLAAESRAAQVARITAEARHSVSGADSAPAQINRRSPFEGDIRSLSRSEKRDRAMQVIEERGSILNARQKDGLDRMLRTRQAELDGSVIAERMLLTENDAYRTGWAKAITSQVPVFTPEEAAALDRFRQFEREHEFRAANEGTPSAGGFGIPVLIDPTIILTSGAADAPILEISRVIQITTNQWKGVTSAGFEWAYQAESAVVADNSPTLAQPTIPVYAARGFIPYTLELEQDYPGFQAEMAMLLRQGYLNLMADKTAQGSGSGEPTGIFTAMANTTTNPAHVTVTTAGTLGATDVRKVWGALPERFRGQSTTRWVSSVSVENVIRAFGNNNALADYTVNLAADGTSVLMGRPMILTDYAPTFTGQTTTFSYAVVGDFSHFIIVQRAGMSVELVPHLFDPSTGRPIGQRGWFAFARAGHNVDTPNAFRVLTNN